MEGFAPHELAAIFRALDKAGWDAVLVGGQAVNVWACHYDRNDPSWRELRPYTSRDLDFHGGLAEAQLAMRVLGAEGTLNTNLDPSPNAGVLKVALDDGREVLIDVLTGVYGVSAAEVERTAVDWSGSGALAGLTLRVIHPLLLLESKAAALRGLPQILKPDDYHLPAQHQRELQRLFLPAWHYVATLSDLAGEGDYITTTLLGRPLILWEIEGQVRAFLNVCPHRFTILTNKSRGRAEKILKCQYHGWEFDECGDTQRIPDARSFRPMEKGELGLKAYRTATCGRLIFVTLDDEAPPLEEFLSPCWDLMQSLFAVQHRDVLELDYEVDCNWKVKIENTLESYHVDLVHPTTFHEMPAAENCSEQLEPNWTSFAAREETHSLARRACISGASAPKWRCPINLPCQLMATK